MLYIASEIVEERPADISQRAWAQMSRAGMEKLADYWHEKILPRHFTAQAKFTYHHARRSMGYLMRKQGFGAATLRDKDKLHAILGGVVDNVVSGAMKDMLSSRSLIKAYPTRATLSMSGPRYMTLRVFEGDREEAAQKGWTYGKGQSFRAKAGIQPDKVKEIGTILLDEKRELCEVLDASIQKDLNAYRERKVTKA